MKKLFILFLLLFVVGCAAVNPPVQPQAPACDGKAVVIQVKEVVANGRHIVFVWLDDTCDGKCDGVVALLYVGTFNGKPQFTPLGLLSCDDADVFISQLKAANKDTCGGA